MTPHSQIPSDGEGMVVKCAVDGVDKQRAYLEPLLKSAEAACPLALRRRAFLADLKLNLAEGRKLLASIETRAAKVKDREARVRALVATAKNEPFVDVGADRLV